MKGEGRFPCRFFLFSKLLGIFVENRIRVFFPRNEVDRFVANPHSVTGKEADTPSDVCKQVLSKTRYHKAAYFGENAF